MTMTSMSMSYAIDAEEAATPAACHAESILGIRMKNLITDISVLFYYYFVGKIFEAKFKGMLKLNYAKNKKKVL